MTPSRRLVMDKYHTLATAANDVERRICEQSPVIAAALNKLIASDLLTDDEKRELNHAWKWGVYGSAIHLQCALGDELRAELNAEHDKRMARFMQPPTATAPASEPLVTSE